MAYHYYNIYNTLHNNRNMGVLYNKNFNINIINLKYRHMMSNYSGLNILKNNRLYKY